MYSNLLAAFQLWVGKDAADGKHERADENKPLIKHCPKCRATKEADRKKHWNPIMCDKCEVQMLDEYEINHNRGRVAR